MNNRESVVFLFDDIQVEPGTFGVLKAGAEVQIEPKTFNVLLFLIENRGRLIEKDELLDALWKDTHVTENALTREIARLRKVLGDDPKQARYIQTVHTKGYRFIAQVEVMNGDRGNGGNAYGAVEIEACRKPNLIDQSSTPLNKVETTITPRESQARLLVSRRSPMLLAIPVSIVLCLIAFV